MNGSKRAYSMIVRTTLVIALAIGIAAFFALLLSGFAIWVFLPLLPAGIVFVVSVIFARRRATAPPSSAKDETDSRKAA